MGEQLNIAPFGSLRVVEVSTDPAGDLLGKLATDLGADVLKVESEGAPGLRAVGPFIDDIEGVDRSLAFAYYNTGKQSLVIPENISPLDAAVRYLADADVLISTYHPAEEPGLRSRYEALLASYPRLIIVALTPFGLDGPWSEFRASDLVSLALGGPLNMCGYDDHEIPPIAPSGNQGYHAGASFGHLGLLYALIDREQSGQGQLVDVALHDALAVTIEMAFPYWSYQRSLVHRQTCRHAQPTPTQPALVECGDGRYLYLTLILNDDRAWAGLVNWLKSHDLAVDLEDPAYADHQFRQRQSAYIQGIFEAFVQLYPAPILFREGQEYGLPVGVVSAPEDLLDDPHLRARGFFQNVPVGEYGELQYPGPPYRFSNLTWKIQGPPPAWKKPDNTG